MVMNTKRIGVAVALAVLGCSLRGVRDTRQVVKVGLVKSGTLAYLVLACSVLVTSTNGLGFTNAFAATVDMSKPPRFEVLEIEPANIRVGESAKLRWRVWNADRVKLGRDSQRTFPSTGEIRITPTAAGARTYELEAVNRAGLVAHQSVSLNVIDRGGREARNDQEASTPIEIRSLTATPMRVRPDQTVTVSWDTRNADKVFFGTGKPMRVRAQGSAQHVLRQTTTYLLVAIGSDGTRVERSVTVEVESDTPRILSFEASARKVRRGESVTFHWETEGTERVFFGPRIGLDKPTLAAAGGSQRQTPRQSTTYFLVAMGANGSKIERDITVQVEAPSSKPVIDVFEADRTELIVGQKKPATVKWRVRGARKVLIVLINGNGKRELISQEHSGSLEFKAGSHPRRTAFLLRAFDAQDKESEHRTVTIRVISQAEATCEKC
jgi:hypothetical protein